MSMRNMKMSAFAVLKGRKATSMTDVESAAKTPQVNASLKKCPSASTTPTGSITSSKDTAISTLLNKITNSEKKKQKLEGKKLKKAMKSMNKAEDTKSAATPPLANGGNVQLKALRPKGSMVNINYPLPLKATPDMPIRSSKKAVATVTPPVPPRDTRPTGKPKAAVKRTGSEFTPPTTLPPRLQRRPSEKSNKGDDGSVPPRPPKRRRLSQGSAPPSPASSNSQVATTVFSPGGRERTEPLPSHPSEKDLGMPYMFDSYVEAQRLFECLIHPVKPDKFFAELFEKKPLLVKRHMPSYNGGWFSTAEFHRILKNEHLDFGKNVDVVTYTNGKRETHNPPGKAYAPVVWDYYQNGCSVRLLNPQTYSRNVWKLLSILQEYFGCMVGANVYLTPPGTQGFAPHYDDIEVFMLQLEGKKHWRLYSPLSDNETLPRYSSKNFDEKEIGEPILDVILEAGDLLYFPRGTIHQGQTLDDAHSLHITVSSMQLNSWGDLLEKLVPRAMEVAIEEDVEFRKSLPRDYLQYMGVAFSDIDNPGRATFLRKIEQLMMKMVTYAPVDASCDQLSKRLIHESLPPVLSEAEKSRSVHGTGEWWDGDEMRVRGAIELEPDVPVKLIRRGAARLVTEDDKVCVYHNLENSRVWHGNEVQCIDISAEMAPAVEYLLHSYPEFVTIDSLPLDTVDDRVELATILYEKGLLITEDILHAISDSGEESSEEIEEHKHKKKGKRKASK